MPYAKSSLAFWRLIHNMSREPMSVYELTTYIKDIIDSDIELNNVTVRGEISNFKHHSSGHMYFTLKDNNAKIKCVMFKSYNLFMKFTPEDGMNVIVQGYVSIYERDGQYQLYCCKIEPDGIGSLYLAFEQLKEKLQKEGLFDQDKKKEIPLCPRRIGVATSPTGAVIRDIINVSTRRFNNVNILLYPVKVQGEGAAQSIVEAIKYFNQRNDIDVIIVGRGGGSIEELWAFNEEIVARAIYESEIPVISAVGHETDYTITDFVADVRASTPSHAAEIAVPSYSDLVYKIESLKAAMVSNISKCIYTKRYYIKGIAQSLENRSPANKLTQNLQYIDNIQNKLIYLMQNKIADRRGKFSVLTGKLDALSPLRVLSRGYAYVEKDKHVVRNVKLLKSGDEIQLNMCDGKAHCKVIDVVEGELWQQEKKI
jgi:exodeoxyribonuclease VII large subunit